MIGVSLLALGSTVGRNRNFRCLMGLCGRSKEQVVMARENQGLQIALIVFVMLTIILGVTTYLFFRQYERSRHQGEDEPGRAGQGDQACARRRRRCQRVEAADRRGQRPRKSRPSTATFNDDMKKFAAQLSRGGSLFIVRCWRRCRRRSTRRTPHLADAKSDQCRSWKTSSRRSRRASSRRSTSSRRPPTMPTRT